MTIFPTAIIAYLFVEYLPTWLCSCYFQLLIFTASNKQQVSKRMQRNWILINPSFKILFNVKQIIQLLHSFYFRMGIE